jgi:hypothetical protein
MNWSEIEGCWEPSKAMLQTHWQELTKEDVDAIHGSRVSLIQALQKRSGCTAEQANASICAFEKDVRLPGTSPAVQPYLQK